MPEDVPGGEIVPFEEIVRRLKVGRATAYKAAGSGDLPSIRVGRRLLVLRAPFERLLRTGRTSEPDNDPAPAHKQK